MLSRRLLALVCVLAIVAGLLPTACAPGATQGPEKIKIGFIVPLTTANALMGWSMQHGAQLAEQEINAAGGINGKPLQLVIEDNAATNEIAVNALNKVMAEKPVALILGSTSSQTMAMSPIIQKAKLTTIIEGSSPTLTGHGNQFLFSTRVTDEFAAIAAVRYAVKDLGKTKIAVFHAAEEFGTSTAPIIVSTLKELGLTPVAVVSAPSTDKDVSAQLLQIKNAGADVILSWVLPAPGILLAQQMKQLKVDVPLVGNPVFALSQVLSLMTPADLKGVYSMTDCVPEQDKDAKVQAFVTAYKARTGVNPDLFGAISYDSVKVLAQVIGKVGSDPDAVRKSLSETKDYPGTCNKYTFDDKGRGAWRIMAVDVASGAPKIVGSVSK